MTIFEFAKQDHEEKITELKYEAVLLDTYMDNKNRVSIYYLHNFFVEVLTNLTEGTLIDIIPYKRGFKLNKHELHNLKKKNAFYFNMAA